MRQVSDGPPYVTAFRLGRDASYGFDQDGHFVKFSNEVVESIPMSVFGPVIETQRDGTAILPVRPDQILKRYNEGGRARRDLYSRLVLHAAAKEKVINGM